MSTLTEINRKIAKLQKQADSLKQREKKGVVERIKVAIAHYGISASELGLTGVGGAKRGRKPAISDGAAPDEAMPRGRGGRSKRALAPHAGKVRFRDAAGNTWSGRGKRPNWFKAELAAGRSPDELLVPQAAEAT